MTNPALVKSADLRRMADIAKQKGVTVWIETIDGRRVGVSPEIPKVGREDKVDQSEEIRL